MVGNKRIIECMGELLSETIEEEEKQVIIADNDLLEVKENKKGENNNLKNIEVEEKKEDSSNIYRSSNSYFSYSYDNNYYTYTSNTFNSFNVWFEKKYPSRDEEIENKEEKIELTEKKVISMSTENIENSNNNNNENETEENKKENDDEEGENVKERKDEYFIKERDYLRVLYILISCLSEDIVSSLFSLEENSLLYTFLILINLKNMMYLLFVLFYKYWIVKEMSCSLKMKM